jgi:TonB family protein
MPILPNALSPKNGLALCALVLILAVPGSLAQEPVPEKEPVYELGHGVVAPRVTHQVAPEHPARGFRISGTVLIGLIVTSKGEPDDVHVIRSLEKDVDQSAVDAVKQWRFDPATKDSKPVAVKISVEIRFHDM